MQKFGESSFSARMPRRVKFSAIAAAEPAYGIIQKVFPGVLPWICNQCTEL